MGINRSTLYEWCKRFPDFKDAIKKGRRPVVEEVVDAFYKNCEGYYVEETTEEIIEMPNGKTRKRLFRHKRYIAPQSALLIFALKNLKKKQFKDKPIDDDAIGFDIKDDALSASLREMGEKLESDKVTRS